jgi:hypothetical protein
MQNEKGLLEPKPAEQDQSQYDVFVATGMSIIYDTKTSEKLIQQITNSPDPIEAIAIATLNIVERVEASAAKNKIKIKDAVLLEGSNVLMGEIISMVEATGMEPLTDEQKYQAFALATSKYLQGAVNSGKMAPEQLKQMGQELTQTPEGQKITQGMETEQNIPEEVV